MNRKQTSKTVARKASAILKDGRYGKKAKSVAGSALALHPGVDIFVIPRPAPLVFRKNHAIIEIVTK